MPSGRCLPSGYHQVDRKVANSIFSPKKLASVTIKRHRFRESARSGGSALRFRSIWRTGGFVSSALRTGFQIITCFAVPGTSGLAAQCRRLYVVVTAQTRPQHAS
jgi:hypothetical protein